MNTARRIALLHSRYKPDFPTREQTAAARQLCDDLPGLVRKATEAGMPRTAEALQEAVQRVGYEMGDLLDAIQHNAKSKPFRHAKENTK